MAVRFGQAVADLLGDDDRRPDAQLMRHPDHVLQVFARHVFHREVVEAHFSAQVVHPADILVRNVAGHLQFVPEPFDVLLSGAISGLRSFRAILALTSLSKTL